MPYGIRTLFEESVSQITATPSVALGTRRVEGSKEYIYVYNGATTAAVNKGMIASAFSGYTCTVSSAVGDQLFGVVQNTELTASYYGWLQTRGLAHIDSANAVALGAPVCLGANGDFEQVLTALAGGTHVANGVAVGAITSGSSGSAFIRGIA